MTVVGVPAVRTAVVAMAAHQAVVTKVVEGMAGAVANMETVEGPREEVAEAQAEPVAEKVGGKEETPGIWKERSSSQPVGYPVRLEYAHSARRHARCRGLLLSLHKVESSCGRSSSSG